MSVHVCVMGGGACVSHAISLECFCRCARPSACVIESKYICSTSCTFTATLNLPGLASTAILPSLSSSSPAQVCSPQAGELCQKWVTTSVYNAACRFCRAAARTNPMLLTDSPRLLRPLRPWTLTRCHQVPPYLKRTTPLQPLPSDRLLP
jgi:hypothetical protein